jgi:hypothetical protein
MENKSALYACMHANGIIKPFKIVYKVGRGDKKVME